MTKEEAIASLIETTCGTCRTTGEFHVTDTIETKRWWPVTKDGIQAKQSQQTGATVWMVVCATCGRELDVDEGVLQTLTEAIENGEISHEDQ